jgi:predicted GH43/DUF377 family glycosyl hydrolase
MINNQYQEPKELFSRFEGNPILTPIMWPYKVNAVFNAGAVVYNDKVLLLVRAEDMRGFSHLCRAVSDDGLTNWLIDSKPTLTAEPDKYPEEFYGIEDPRIIKLEEEFGDETGYAVAYTSFSLGGPLVSLAMTKDFESFHKIGVVMTPDDKDASLFPRKFNGRWALLHRPTPTNSRLGAHIWISYSPDLVHWGNSSVVLPAREGSWWDANKIGLGPPPIETAEGWLIIYHGVRQTAAGCIYRLGFALLDLEDPRKVIKRCNEWAFGPHEIYERVGDVPDVTFPCGVIVKDDTLFMYYGAADTTIAVATASIKSILESF